MGIVCQSKKQKDREPASVQITDINQMKIVKSDFIQQNNGSFKESF